MQFVIRAKDATDADALNRRHGARARHLANIEDNRDHMIAGAATLDENGNMNGSVMIVDFQNRGELDAWLAREPYITDKVWHDVEITPCMVGATFMQKLGKN